MDKMKTELIRFIKTRTHLNSNKIKPELRLAADIGLFGMDAIGFFEEFFKEFDINNPEEFDSDLYIDGSVDFVPRPLKWVANLIFKERRKYVSPDVTLGHLDKVIQKGKWFDEK